MSKSADKQFQKLDDDLKNALKTLAEKITPNIYRYEFLKK